MKISTYRFGEIEIDENRIFNFVLPIIGFDKLERFVLLDLNKDNFFKWLQAVDDPALAFPVVSVFSMNLDYSIDLQDNIVELLKIKNVESLLVMNIASIPSDDPSGATINLLAPLIFNVKNKLAGQIILSGSGYEVSCPIFEKGATE